MIEALIAIIAIVAVGVVIFMKSRPEKKYPVWVVPLTTLDALLPEAEERMINAGFAKEDYVLHFKDCSQYAPMWVKVLRGLLAPHRPSGMREWIREYSFQRDLREDGSNPGRHRVVGVKTGDGMKFIDTYRINGSLYRQLSEAELRNGQWNP